MKYLFPFAKYKVEGKSMEPALKMGDNVLISKIGKIKNGDIVIYSASERDYIKRVKAAFGDEYFLEGDNKNFSTDSRKFGAVQRKGILGKVILKY